MMKFSVASANRMVIDSTGNVGIGLSYPESLSHKLEVNGAIHISGEMTAPAAPTNGDGGILYARADGKLFWRSNELHEEVSTGCTSCATYDVATIPGHNIVSETVYTVAGGDFALSDYILAIRTGSGNNNHIKIELPSASANTGKVYVIKDIDGNLGSGDQRIILQVISGGGAIEPNNAGAATLNSANAAVSVFSDGANWFIF